MTMRPVVVRPSSPRNAGRSKVSRTGAGRFSSRHEMPQSTLSAASSAVRSARSWTSPGTCPSRVSSAVTAARRSGASTAVSQARLRRVGKPASSSLRRSGFGVAPATAPRRLGRRLCRFLALMARREVPLRSAKLVMTHPQR